MDRKRKQKKQRETTVERQQKNPRNFSKERIESAKRNEQMTKEGN